MSYLILTLVSQLLAKSHNGNNSPAWYQPNDSASVNFLSPEPMPNGFQIPYYSYPQQYPVPATTTTTPPYYPLPKTTTTTTSCYTQTTTTKAAPYYPVPQVTTTSNAPYYPPAQSSSNPPYYPPAQSSSNPPYYPPAQSSSNPPYNPSQSQTPNNPSQTASQVIPSPSGYNPYPNNSTTPSGDKVVVGYYVPWGQVEPSAINFKGLTHINYGFGTLYQKNSPANITIDQYYDGTKIKELKKYGSQNNVKVLISIGGWTGSQTFSTVAKDSGLIDQFVQNALYFVRKDGYDLDGIDIDWEYPVCQGSDNNAKDPNDSTNYLNLLKALRTALDKEFGNGNKLITAAVRVEPFFDPKCSPMTDVSAFAKYFDFVNIMAYDIMGPWSSTTGPSAPHTTDSKNSNSYSFAQSIQSWIKAGFPANKLVGGLAFYGHSMTATVDMTADPSNIYVSKSSVTPKGDKFDTCEANAINNEGAICSGVWKYTSIRSQIIDSNGNCQNGWKSYWDEGTQTPWVFNTQTKVFLSYDDVKSIGIKVAYAKQQNIRGVMIWELSMDHNNELMDVAKTIRSG